MLLGAPLMLAFVRDRRDDRRLIVIPAVRGDAGLLADLRARAVGADQKPRGNRLAVAKLDLDRIRRELETADRAGAQIDAELFCLGDQRIDQMPVLHHVGEGLALFHLAAESEERRPHRVVEFAIGHHHVEDRLRLVGNRVPHPDRLEQPARRRRDGRGARVLRWRGGERRVDDRHRKHFAQALAQRDPQRQAGKPRPADRQVGFPMLLRSFRHAVFSDLPCKTPPSIAG